MKSNANVNASSNVKKPFCKVCHDTGKPESVYTSHWVKTAPDRSGKSIILCPTLLSTECRYCFQAGHTTKFCQVLAKNEKNKTRNQRLNAYEETQKKNESPAENKPTTRFGALIFDSDSDDEFDNEQEKQVKKEKVSDIVEEFPVLGNVPKKVNMEPVKSGWAAVAAKTKEEKELEDYQNKLEEISMKRMLPQSAAKKVDVVLPKLKKASEMCWAEWDTDSEDENEQEQVFPEINSNNYKFNYNYVNANNAAIALAKDEDW